MRLVWSALIVCALSATLDAAGDADTMQGFWKRIAGIRDGKPMTGSELDARIAIEGDRYTLTQAGSTSSGTFRLNETAQPKTIDLMPEDGPDQGKPLLGIYEIRAGNRHRVCFAAPGAARPSKFESKPGSGYLFEELERLK
ncbi:MAG: TIGR03067 domain-containing protein [Candidatus Solibacter usitatus]|nr:TIGR03067 domain-containing protein [Candidatus Solibacter usitatus]